MSDRKDTRGYKSTSGNRQHINNEQHARQQAYEEYLRLREKQSTRGTYVKSDTLYGAYFPGGAQNREQRRHEASNKVYSGHEGSHHGNGIENTPYGTSEMRKNNLKKEEELEKYLEERAKAKREKKNTKNSKIKQSRRLKIALVAVLVLVLAIGGVIATGFTVVKKTLDNVGKIEIDPAMLGINPQVDSELQNYRNIAILGIDSRDMSSDEGVRSDAMIIVSINKETNEIKMFSVYRDTMLNLGDDVGLDKVTHAYYYGGPTQVLNTLNRNLDLNIKEVVVVNWKSVADTVDALGGLDIEIQESEIKEMNKYIKDTQKNIGGSKELIEEPGMQTLNGNQAVTYARIRKDAVTGDYRRNERMKIVVKAAFEKAKTMDKKTIDQISDEILPQIKTNMSSADMMNMALKLPAYNMTDSVGFPYNVSDWNGGAYYGIPVTLSANVSKLHEEFFAQEDYVPTQEVQSISESIAAKTGYY